MKKIISFFVAVSVIAGQIQFTQAADSLPSFPMSIWGTLKDSKGSNVQSGSTVDIYVGGNLVSSYVTDKSGQYGGSTAYEKSIALEGFTGSLTMKIKIGANIFNISGSDINDSNKDASCPSGSNITFFSGICRYDITVNNTVSLAGGSITSTGSTLLSSGSISQGGNLSVSGTNISIASDTSSSGALSGSLTLSGVTNILVSGASWDGYIVPPETVATGASENATTQELGSLLSSSNTNTLFQTVHAGGPSGVTLTASGSNFRLRFTVSSGSAGQTLNIFRSSNGSTWEKNSPDATCTLDSSKICDFQTNHLSYFAPVLSIANQTSSSTGGGGGGGSTSSTTTTTVATTTTTVTSTGTTDSQSGATETVNTEPIVITDGTGEVSISDNRITVSSLKNPFKDTSSNFAKNDISFLALKGAVKGFSDGTFRPDNQATRAEFLAMVFKSMDIEIDSGVLSTTFTDIPSEGNWMIKYVEAAKKFGINGQVISGKKVFRPNDPITRAEALAILLKVGGINIEPLNTTAFTDITTEWVIPYAENARRLGITSGQIIGGKRIFRPSDPITRAESARMIIKTMVSR